MKRENLSDAIGCVDEALIEEAQNVRTKKRKGKWLAWVAAAACIAVAVAIARPMFIHEAVDETVPLGKAPQTVLHDAPVNAVANKISQAEYPKMLPHPELVNDDWDRYSEELDQWWDVKTEYRESIQEPEKSDYFDAFYKTSALEFLAQSNGENIVYSPSNVYMALAMLAELTDGESRGQILDVLGTENIESLRTQAKHLWGSNYCDDGRLTTKMANSLWLADGLPYRQETMDLIAQEYYASAFSGIMGSEEYSEALRQWINENTNELLKEDVKELGFDPRTVMALASTIYFKGRWSDTFAKSATAPDTFHGANGDMTADFMHTSEMGRAYWGESYTAVSKSMESGASMWLILPDEGKSIDDVLKDGEIFAMTSGHTEWSQNKSLQINLSMPKFDVSSKFDLIEGLQSLGVNDVFDYAASDFTPMSEEIENVYVSRAEHAARVMVDEEGCEAAAYTVMMMECGAAICEDELDFVLDRPFIFVISGCGDQPLFIGVVNEV